MNKIIAIEGAEQTTTTTLPGVTNPQERVTLDGVTVSETDAAGNVSAVTNALGNVIEYAYDVRGSSAN